MHIKLRIPATSANLGAGFDVFGAALKIYNTVSVFAKEHNPRAGRSLNDIIKVEIKAGDQKSAPQSFQGLENLIRKAVFTAINEFKLGLILSKKYSSIDIVMTNNAPLARGLGSSASAITGAICAVNALGGSKISVEHLLEFACKIEGHPDNIIPAFFGGLCVSAESLGRFVYVKIKMPDGLKSVLCVPDFGMSTEAARKLLPSKVAFKDAVFNASRSALLVSAIAEKKYGMLGVAMQDRLHQPYRKKLIPGFDDVICSALGSGAYGAALSGAGSIIIAICPDNKKVCERVGKAMVGTFLKRRLGSRYIICGFDNEGVKQLK